MARLGGAAVDAAISEMKSTLVPHADRDWEVKAGTLDWTCWEVAAHVAHDLVKYAAQVAAQPRDAYLPIELAIRRDATPDVVVSVVGAAGAFLGLAVRAADESTRGWHWGLSDAAGFAAMGIGEVLVHTFDIATSLGIPWRPPDGMAEPVVERLLPDAPSGKAGDVLLWATGRSPLGDRAAATSWVWKAAR